MSEEKSTRKGGLQEIVLPFVPFRGRLNPIAPDHPREVAASVLPPAPDHSSIEPSTDDPLPLLRAQVEEAFRGGSESERRSSFRALLDHLVATGATRRAAAVEEKMRGWGWVGEAPEEVPQTEPEGPADEAPVGATERPSSPPASDGPLPAEGSVHPEGAPVEAGGAPVEAEGALRGEAEEAEDEWVDFAALVLQETDTKGPRWEIDAPPPTGEEEEDFAHLLAEFRSLTAESSFFGKDPATRYELGVAYRSMGLLREAVSEFQAVLRTTPGDVGVLEQLGECFLELGEGEVALRTLERALPLPGEADGAEVGLQYLIGRAYEMVGRRRRARRHFEKVIERDIDFRDAAERLERLR